MGFSGVVGVIWEWLVHISPFWGLVMGFRGVVGVIGVLWQWLVPLQPLLVVSYGF